MTRQRPRVEALAAVPDLLAMHRAAPSRYPFLLESTAAHPVTGRHDVLFAASGEHLTLHAGERGDFLGALDGWWRGEQGVSDPDLPFSGGWFLFAGYELAGRIEPRLRLPESGPGGVPVAFAARCPGAVVVERATKRAWIVTEPGRRSLGSSLRDDALAAAQPAKSVGAPLPVCSIEEEPDERYLAAVARAQAYVREGDIFQANLSRQWRGQFEHAPEPADVYQALRASNPGPFAGLARWGARAIVSSSPERLVRRRGPRIETRPIAGTRPRHAEAGRDRESSSELMVHPKERAEHVMLIDLERNDLGRICRPGSVAVDEMMILESYAHVHHIVSNVAGRVRDGLSPGEVLRAVFPGGTITGCPKVRCMEIIAELEDAPRGIYTGSMGYLNRDGSMDMNILIRSLLLEGPRLSFRTGGGIVVDSEPHAELDETRHKARGLLMALRPQGGQE